MHAGAPAHTSPPGQKSNKGKKGLVWSLRRVCISAGFPHPQRGDTPGRTNKCGAYFHYRAWHDVGLCCCLKWGL
eukprot:12884397-Prorocentrum_lima.AAC.1